MSESNKKVKNNGEENKNNNFKFIITMSVICFMVLCATVITIVVINSSKSKDSDKTKEKETIDIFGTDNHATDEKNLDEVIAQVKNCIADASISNIEIVEATYTYNGNEVICSKSEGTDLSELIVQSLDGASSVSKANPKNDIIKITIKNNNKDGFDVTAEFAKS